EIRTPMNGIIGYTEMLMDSRLNSEQMEYAHAIKQSGEALLTLINDILDFSKIEAGQIDLEAIEFDPELTAYDVCDLVRPRIIKKPIEILCRIENEVPAAVRGDPARFRQVLVNLMGNAAKFTESGEIELSVSVDEETDSRIRLHTKVRDTGSGIPEEKVEGIFETFKQADSSTTREYGGTGLGLSICKRIADLMNGDIWAESRAGNGSTFHFTAFLQKSGGAPSPKYLPVSLQGKKVLIVDDNENNLDILAYILKGAKMRVTALTKESEVLPALRGAWEDHAPFDLCVLDIFMPNIDGYELAARIRQSEPPGSHVPLLAFSSSVVHAARKCKEAGFDGFLPKPIRREKFFRMAERLIGKECKLPQGDRTLEKDKKIMTQHSVHEDMKWAVRILLAEDNPVNQKLTKVILTKAGYQVDVAEDGRKAVEKYREDPLAYQMILMDIQMPNMDGIQATEAIRKHEALHPDKKINVPIVALTANAIKGDREKCLAAGMNDYMTKPIKREEIYSVIKKWVLEKEGP
ncbi:MAG: response regulator, partial [Deltaproteobacteria bacterium]|nr:response regulator [Deltaproteobacteria bacterium]